MLKDENLARKINKGIEDSAVLDWFKGLVTLRTDSTGMMCGRTAVKARKKEASHKTEGLLNHWSACVETKNTK
jgi:hypothetical protein